jgi:hypothetical protein
MQPAEHARRAGNRCDKHAFTSTLSAGIGQVSLSPAHKLEKNLEIDKLGLLVLAHLTVCHFPDDELHQR